MENTGKGQNMEEEKSSGGLNPSASRLTRSQRKKKKTSDQQVSSSSSMSKNEVVDEGEEDFKPDSPMDIDSDSKMATESASPFKTTPAEDVEMEDVSDQRKQELKNELLTPEILRKYGIVSTGMTEDKVNTFLQEKLINGHIYNIGDLLKWAKNKALEQLEEKLGDGPGANVYAFLQENFPDEMRQGAAMSQPIIMRGRYVQPFLHNVEFAKNPQNYYEKYISLDKNYVKDSKNQWEKAPEMAVIANESQKLYAEFRSLEADVKKTEGSDPVVDQNLLYPCVDANVILDNWLVYPPLTQGQLESINIEHQKKYPRAKVRYLGNQMYAYEYSKLFSSLVTDNTKKVLLTRFDSRNVVDTAIRQADNREIRDDGSIVGSRKHSAIVGNPGIGKSFNLLYAMQVLTSRGETILYCDRKRQQVFLFIRNPQSGEYEAWKISDSSVDVNIGDFRFDVKIFVLIDPNEKGTELADGEAVYMLAASANEERHLRSLRKNGMKILYTTTWSIEELLAAEPYFLLPGFQEGTIQKKDQIIQRYGIVGGSPRYVFAAEDDFEIREGLIANFEISENALNGLLFNYAHTYLQAFPKYESRDPELQSAKVDARTLPSTIFSSNGYCGTDNKQFVQFAPDFLDRVRQIGDFPYGFTQLSFLSKFAMTTLFQRYRAKFLNIFSRVQSEDAVRLGHHFENFVRYDLSKKASFPIIEFSVTFKGKDLTQEKLQICDERYRELKHLNADELRNILSETNPGHIMADGNHQAKTIIPAILGVDSIEITMQEVQPLRFAEIALNRTFFRIEQLLNHLQVLASSSATNNRRVLLIPPANFPCLDFLDGPRRWYQCTINRRHVISVSGALNTLESIGLIEKREAGRYECRGRLEDAQVTLYICVPEAICKSFTTPMPYEGGDVHQKILLDEIITQKLLVIPNTLIEQA